MGFHPFRAFAQQVEFLDAIGRTHGHDHPAAHFQLIHQGLGDPFGRAGDDDRIEGGHPWPPEGPVAEADLHIPEAQPLEIGFGTPGQRLHDLDAVHLRHQARQHGRLVTRARADLQHPIGRLRIQRGRHEGHDVGLGDGLPVADGQGPVLVGQGALGGRHEFVPGHPGHGREHSAVLDAASHDLIAHHAGPGRLEGSFLRGRRRRRGFRVRAPHREHQGHSQRPSHGYEDRSFRALRQRASR